MSVLRYATHADVVIDPATPVPRWGLSERGRARVGAMLGQPWIDGVARLVCSDETKARETAGIVADHLGLGIEVRPGTGENDRSATGFVPPDEFEALADAFYGRPEESVRGWERAVDAQTRIVAALADLVADDGADVLVVGHGGVGTLWYCHLAEVAISRRFDQPTQGQYFTLDRTTGTVRHHWRPIDRVEQG